MPPPHGAGFGLLSKHSACACVAGLGSFLRVEGDAPEAAGRSRVTWFGLLVPYQPQPNSRESSRHRSFPSRASQSIRSRRCWWPQVKACCPASSCSRRVTRSRNCCSPVLLHVAQTPSFELLQHSACAGNVVATSKTEGIRIFSIGIFCGGRAPEAVGGRDPLRCNRSSCEILAFSRQRIDRSGHAATSHAAGQARV